MPPNRRAAERDDSYVSISIWIFITMNSAPGLVLTSSSGLPTVADFFC